MSEQEAKEVSKEESVANQLKQSEEPSSGVVGAKALEADVEEEKTSEVPAKANEIVSESIRRQFVRLPNITLPCTDGVLIDVWSYLPENADQEKSSIDYFFGKVVIEGKMIRVFPDAPGEQVIGITYFYKGARSTLDFKLLVNQDPKKLWVRNDPPCGSPFMKELSAMKSFRDEHVRFVAASRRGRSHEMNGTFRDDDFSFCANSKDGIYLMVVADGAGSARYSREGSRLAVEFLCEDLFPQLTPDIWGKEESPEAKDGRVAQVISAAAYKAMARISAFCAEENKKPGVTDKYALKDFNTTLLVAALRFFEDGALSMVTFSIGDGAIAWVERGASELLCAPDGGEFSGQTRFLTTPGVWPRAESEWAAFRQSRVFTKLVAPDSARQGFVAVMTDGVSDPFFETDAKLHDMQAWDDFVLNDADVDEGAKSLREILEVEEESTAAEKLMTWLGFWSRGNHDDRTLGLLNLVNVQGAFFEKEGGAHGE